MKTFFLSFFCLLFTLKVYSQDNPVSDSVEVYMIDNYVTSDKPPLLIVSFYTSISAKSNIIIDNQYKYVVSNELNVNHRDTIDLSDLKFKSKQIHFVIQGEDSLNRKYTSDIYEIDIPQEVEIKGDSNFLLLCLLGGTVFLLPSPDYVNWGGTPYFSLTKEIPLVFIRSGSFSYPLGYFSLEYSFIYQAPVRSFLRIGYKHIIEVPGIEYVSPGVNGITNLNGYNGISPELSIGWLRIFDTFTLYSRFRYNFKPGSKNSEFGEISIGLYSGFFAIYF
ncbi:MAG: hypothetical protein P4L27_00765 [Ignavibacteriaceae bacterium]|nr:hypothetical protein [Ignavibacteriaceae bacterium]